MIFFFFCFEENMSFPLYIQHERIPAGFPEPPPGYRWSRAWIWTTASSVSADSAEQQAAATQWCLRGGRLQLIR